MKVANVGLTGALQSDIVNVYTAFMFGVLKLQDRIGVLIRNVRMVSQAVNLILKTRFIPG